MKVSNLWYFPFKRLIIKKHWPGSLMRTGLHWSGSKIGLQKWGGRVPSNGGEETNSWPSPQWCIAAYGRRRRRTPPADWAPVTGSAVREPPPPSAPPASPPRPISAGIGFAHRRFARLLRRLGLAEKGTSSLWWVCGRLGIFVRCLLAILRCAIK